LQCIEPGCSNVSPIDQTIYVCPRCQGLLDVRYDFNTAGIEGYKALFAKRRTSNDRLDRSGVWRFRELLPFLDDFSFAVTLAEGNTPLYDAPGSATYAGLSLLRFKHQGLNPTGSFKDNGMTTGVAQARALRATAVACASTGNTSASMAAYAARAGIRAFVFIPAGQIAYGKLSQSIEYGATVVEIEGNFDDAMRIVRELAEATGLYLLNSINPFRLEGQKTIAIELIEQLEWQPPDWIVVPGGNLGNSSAIGKALRELSDLGMIDRVPKLAVIQAEGASPFYKLFISRDAGPLAAETDPSTLATAIKIGNPVSWKKAMRAVEWTRGVVEQAGEQEIADAKATIGRDGIGCEPASAATLAGIRKLVEAGTMNRDESVVAILTGNLLKDPDYTVDYHSERLSIGDRRIAGSLANKLVRAPANRDSIRRLLEI
jgi:threonine synthase